jgi:hypothetical protein
MTSEQQKLAARACGWPEEKIRWNGGFYPGFVQVQVVPATPGRLPIWEKFTGQKYDG